MRKETGDPSLAQMGASENVPSLDAVALNLGHAGSVFSCMQPDVHIEYRSFSADQALSIVSRLMEMERRGVRFLPEQVIRRALRKTLKPKNTQAQ